MITDSRINQMIEVDTRFEIVIHTTISNIWRTNNLDAALTKVASMVGKIRFEFHDKENNKVYVVNDSNDYLKLLKNYR